MKLEFFQHIEVGRYFYLADTNLISPPEFTKVSDGTYTDKDGKVFDIEANGGSRYSTLVHPIQTLKVQALDELGTPWAETYRGSGRFTGRLAAEPVYTQSGEVASGWTWVGDMTQENFDFAFLHQEHDHCHNYWSPDFGCRFCEDAGWLEPGFDEELQF